MTQVKITRHKSSITSVTCDGHTDYGHHGEDIVCSALSSIVQTALLGLISVVGIKVVTQRDDSNGYLHFSLPLMHDECKIKSNAILDTMMCGVRDLQASYSDYIKIIVEDN